MSRYVQFVTPENIEVTYELAGAGSRSLAALIDHLVQLALLVAAYLVSSALGVGLSFGSGAAATWADAVYAIAAFVVIFGYFVVFEVAWGGRTPGKRAAGLRVVRDSGYPIDPFAAIVRNLVRIVDFLPPIYGAGLASVFFSAQYKRLGDWAAGTIVIKERQPAPPSPQASGPPSPAVAELMALITGVESVTPQELRVIRRFAWRRRDLDLRIQAHIAMRLAQPLLPRLGLERHVFPAQIQYADLLEAVERRAEEARMKDEG